MPTRPVITIDVPEPKEFNSKFIYRFFQKDESTNDSGIDLSQFDSFEVLQDKLNREVPRYVTLTWVKPQSVTDANNPNNSIFDDITLSEVFDTAVSEVEFSTTSFTGISFQDNSIDQKLFALVSGTINRSKNLFNVGLTDAYNEIAENINDALTLQPFLLQDAAKLVTIGNTEVDNLILDALSDIEKLNAQYLTDDSLNAQIDQTFDRIKNVKLDMQLNTKLAYTILHDVVTDPVGTFTDELAPIMDKVRDAQVTAIEATDPTIIDENDYELYAEPTFIDDVDVDFTYYNTPRKLIGYIIERYEIRSDGSRIKLDSPIIIDNSDVTIAYDTKIKYGKRYAYELRSVIAMKFITVQSDTAKVITAVIKSRPVTTVIMTSDTVPPPWPADFQVSWNKSKKKPRLTWSFPVNSQRDIKQFQIFRRATVDEPYQLIKQYSFDDSELLYNSGEIPDPELVEFVEHPPLHFIDEEFEVDASYMYTMGCIDAHGLVSNFSSQVLVRFDPVKNSVKRTLISGPNAPRPYPNMYLEEENAIIDVIKDSRHSKVKLYFNPEYAEVYKKFQTIYSESSINPIGLLPFASSDANSTDIPKPNHYKLQILNTDLQQTRNIDIVINDRSQLP